MKNIKIKNFLETIRNREFRKKDIIPEELYFEENYYILAEIADMGLYDVIIAQAPGNLKEDHHFLKSISPTYLNEKNFLEELEVEGVKAFYHLNGEYLEDKTFLKELLELGYSEEVALHLPEKLKNDSELIEEIANFKIVEKIINVSDITNKKETPEDGFENVWGQKETEEHFQAKLEIDNNHFIFNKYVSYIPMRETDDYIVTINFQLNNKSVAMASITFDEKIEILDKNAFSLVKMFNINEVETPLLSTIKVKLFQKDWESLLQEKKITPKI